ncbi:MAG: hypothetical protein AB7G47_19315 [Mycolicibacterium sp.]|uniref:hypothetical protein n=1 Tax=Mycolicibacterium sp. TaxID=2320850 RepID=UPI003D0D0DB2
MIDIYVTVDDADHVFYRKPNRAADALASATGAGVVRSVTVLDRSTGLTSNYRSDI